MDTTPDCAYNEDPSTSTSSPSEFRLVDFNSIVKQAKEGKFDPWKAEITSNGKVKFEFLTIYIVYQNTPWRWTIAWKFQSWYTTGPY